MESEANCAHMSLLSKFYKRIFHEHFLSTGASFGKQSPTLRHNDYISNCYRFGWLLFLALKNHTFSRFMDLVTCTNGLISVLAILIIHMPTCFRNFNLCDSDRFVRKGDRVDLLASLCSVYQASEDDLREACVKASNLIIEIMGKFPHQDTECGAINLDGINMDGLLYFNELLDPSFLLPGISLLEKDYGAAIRNEGALDERELINQQINLSGPRCSSGGSININTLKRTNEASPEKKLATPLSPYQSPAPPSREDGVHGNPNSKLAATPVSAAMTTAKWLRTIICPLPEKPSPSLQNFLSSCDKDITADVVGRANIILEAIFSSGLQSANRTDNIWAEQRRVEALKLYYKVLESMCTAESQILHSSNLTPLLTNEKFHRCMLACSAELVLAIHKTVTMLFPTVLEQTGITAFDLSKVVECFVRHEESLPRELRRHLNSLEERLLESMVWESGSSMYNSLIVAKPVLSEEINRLGLVADPIPSLDTIAKHVNISLGGLSHFPSLPKHEVSAGQSEDLQSPKRLRTNCQSVLVERNSFTSPVKGRLMSCTDLKAKNSAPLQSVFCSPTRPKPGGGGESYAQTGINILFSKVLKLSAVRINGLVERLQLSQQIKESVYSLFQKILSHRTTLFFNRHIDQIILCCFYGVSKILQKNLTFREIIHNYRKQPQCKPQIIHSVFVDWACIHDSGKQKTGQGHVDIIMFYNKVFIPAVKPLLVEFGPGGVTSRDNPDQDVKCPGSPSISPFSSLPDMSPRKVSAKQNVYVSPLRSSKMDALISHSSRSYYACVGESTHAYQSPSKDLTAINIRLNVGRKVRGMLNFEDVDIGLVSDRVVAESLRLSSGASAPSSTPLKNLE